MADIQTDAYREVIMSSFALVDSAKEIADDDERVFEFLLDMVQDFKETAFTLLKDGRS